MRYERTALRFVCNDARFDPDRGHGTQSIPRFRTGKYTDNGYRFAFLARLIVRGPMQHNVVHSPKTGLIFPLIIFYLLYLSGFTVGRLDEAKKKKTRRKTALSIEYWIFRR